MAQGADLSLFRRAKPSPCNVCSCCNRQVHAKGQEQQNAILPQVCFYCSELILTMSFALVTGASKGIGKAIAMELASRKKDILLVSRNESQLRALATDIHQKY